jgi:DNA-binding response OmpR family regulator
MTSEVIMKILLAEDERDLQEVVVAYLEYKG